MPNALKRLKSVLSLQEALLEAYLVQITNRATPSELPFVTLERFDAVTTQYAILLPN